MEKAVSALDAALDALDWIGIGQQLDADGHAILP